MSSASATGHSTCCHLSASSPGVPLSSCTPGLPPGPRHLDPSPGAQRGWSIHTLGTTRAQSSLLCIWGGICFPVFQLKVSRSRPSESSFSPRAGWLSTPSPTQRHTQNPTNARMKSHATARKIEVGKPETRTRGRKMEEGSSLASRHSPAAYVCFAAVRSWDGPQCSQSLPRAR